MENNLAFTAFEPGVQAMIEAVASEAVQLSPPLSRPPSLAEAQHAAILFNHLRLRLTNNDGLAARLRVAGRPQSEQRLAQVKEQLVQARFNYFVRVEHELSEAFRAETLQNNAAVSQDSQAGNNYQVHATLQNFEFRLRSAFMPVAEVLEVEGRPALKQQLTNSIGEIDQAIQISVSMLADDAATQQTIDTNERQSLDSFQKALVEGNKRQVKAFEATNQIFMNYLKTGKTR